MRGFTIIELVFYLAIAIAVLFAGTIFIWDVIDNKAKSTAYQEVQQNARFYPRLPRISGQSHLCPDRRELSFLLYNFELPAHQLSCSAEQSALSLKIPELK